MAKKNVEIKQEERLLDTLEDVELKDYSNLIETTDYIYSINKDNTSCTLHKIKNISECLNIPNKIDNYIVTDLENKNSESIFEDTETIRVTTINIPDSVIVIGKHCFNECKFIKNIIFGKGVVTLDVGCFSYCDSLEKVVIPENVKFIEDYAFRNCSSLKKITILNKDCQFSDNSYIINTSTKTSKDIGRFEGIIYGWEDSTTQQFAEKFNKMFEKLEYKKIDISFIGKRPYDKVINKQDIKVIATWSNSETEEIYDFVFSTKELTDDIEVEVKFLFFTEKMLVSIRPRVIDGIIVSHRENCVFKTKTPLIKDDFIVIAHYDDETEEEIKDFEFKDNIPNKKGDNKITVKYKEFENHCNIFVKPKFLIF